MVKRRGPRLHIAAPARRDIAAIIKRTTQEFGLPASLRYSALIKQALLDVEADYDLPGSMERPEIMVDGARTYHISLSRTKGSGPRVKSPRHFILYRHREDGTIEVARVLHDARDIERHLPETYRRPS